MKLKIYKSSAGSGKTYQLVQEYLVYALSNPHQFSRILAVTFTNKATAEMKERVLETTYALASSSTPSELSKSLQKELNCDEDLLRKKAKNLLFNILHQYNNLHISTIDSFFQQVVRAFARDYHLPARYNISLNKKELLHEVIDLIFADEETDPRLRKHLLYLTSNYIEDNERWDVRSMLKSFCEYLEFLPSTKILDEISHCENPIDLHDKWSLKVKNIIKSFENLIQTKIDLVYNILDKYEIKTNDFHTHAKNIFSKWENKEYTYSTNKIQNILENGFDEWTTKTKPNLNVVAAAQNGFHQIFIEIYSILHSQEFITYNTAKEVLPSLSKYVVLVYVQQQFEDYKKSQEIVLNSDNSLFLNQMIDVAGDAPFIYEKTGMFFKQYLIDEFQDTSPEQWQNFLPLLDNSLSLQYENMIVGDVKQSIYRFRGGDWRLLNAEVEKQFKYQSELFVLNTNYRSACNIISGVNQLFPSLIKKIEEHFEGDSISTYQKIIESIYEDVAQKFAPHRETKEAKKGVIQFTLCSDNLKNENPEDNISWKELAIKKSIEKIELLQQEGVSPSDICILVRKASEGREFIEAIQEHSREHGIKDISYTIISQDSLLLNNAISIQILIAAIKVIHDESLLHITTLCYLLNEYENVIKDLPYQKEFTIAATTTQSNILLSIKKVKSLPFYDIFEALIQEWQLYRYKDENPYLESFMDIIYQYASNKINDAKYFIDYWDKEGVQLKLQSAENVKAINLMTIHKAKGLQFSFVISPFLNWKMYDTGTLSPTLWVKTKKGNPLKDLPTLPIKFSANLVQTEFSQYYYDEKFQMLVENINLLYVIITRAMEGFFGYFDENSKKNNIAVSILHSLKDNEVYNYDIGENIYHIGEMKDILLPKNIKDQPSKNIYQINYTESADWKNRIVIKATDQLLESTYFGTLMHQILSEIIYWEDVDKCVNKAKKIGKINNNEKKQILSILLQLNRNSSIVPFFTPEEDTEILTEVPIIIKSGHQLRIDRLHINKKKNTALVIDFKTGDSRNENTKKHYINQVKRYKTTLKEMNFQEVQGYLIHLKDGELESV